MKLISKISILLLFLIPEISFSATFTIPDGDVPALIAAINTANTNGTPDIIELAPGGTYIFTTHDHETFTNSGTQTQGFTALPLITNEDWPTQNTLDLTIRGNGATFTKASGPLFRFLATGVTTMLLIEDLNFENGRGLHRGGAVFSGWRSNLEVDGCSFTGNQTYGDQGTFDQGGGAIMIASESQLEIRNCDFNNNAAQGMPAPNTGGNGGGAVMCLLSDMLVEDCNFDGNSSDNNAGALYTDGALGDTGSFTVRRCTFTNNSSGGGSGAFLNYMYNQNQSLIEDCHFEGNEASDGHGGAIYSGAGSISHSTYTGVPNSTQVTIQNCSFIDNEVITAGDGGGAIFINEHNSTIESCTFSGNVTSDLGTTLFVGGKRLSCSLNNLTVAGNGSSSSTQRALFVAPPTSGTNLVDVKNCIFSNNNAGHISAFSLPQLQLLGNNIQYPGTDFGAAMTSADPLLSAPAFSGSDTKTMALSAGSPAIDAGASCTSTDQIGQARVGACDIGAAEFVAPPCVFNIPDGDVAGLIAAINASNADACYNIINLAAGGTYNLTAIEHILNPNTSLFEGERGTPVIMGQHADLTNSKGITFNGNGSTIQRDLLAPDFGLFTVKSFAGVVFNDITFKNAKVNSQGAAVFMRAKSRVEFNNCTFENNESLLDVEGGGGCIYSVDLAEIFINNCTFENNRAVNQGGVISVINTNIDAQDCVFRNNTLTVGSGTHVPFGGAVYMDGAGRQDGHFKFDNCTFENNTAPTPTASGTSNGGGLYLFPYNDQTAEITNCTFINNSADQGGGFSFSGGPGAFPDTWYPQTATSNFKIKFQNNLFDGNHADGNGGGAFIIKAEVIGGGISDCTFENNTANDGSGGGVGGGLFLNIANHTTNFSNVIFDNNLSNGSGGLFFTGRGGEISDCTFKNNDGNAFGASTAGGGLVIFTDDNVTIKNSTFNSNTARIGGAARFQQTAGAVDVLNCTFHSNIGTDFGGAVAVIPENDPLRPVSFTNCTFANNDGGSEAGAIRSSTTGGSNSSVTVKNCIFYNQIVSGSSNKDCNSTFTDGGNNLFDASLADCGCFTSAGSSLFSTNPMLLPLADNGGPTETMALSAGSPAIDAGAGCTTTDQIGQARVGACDIGAVEFVASACVFNIPDGDVAALIAAINTSNTDGCENIINLAASGTYDLTAVNYTSASPGTSGFEGERGLPNIMNDVVGLDVTINGNGATVQRNTSAPNFGLFSAKGHTIFNHVIFRNALVNAQGAAVFVQFKGHVEFYDCEFYDNESLIDVEGGGGGIYTKSLSQLHVEDCHFEDNRAVNQGGAISNLLSDMTILNSTFINNETTTTTGDEVGGAVYDDGARGDSGSLIVRNSLFENNSSNKQGGALFLFPYNHNSVEVTNCTFKGNTCETGAGFWYDGGGHLGGIPDPEYPLSDRTGLPTVHTLLFHSNTFENNTATSQGGGFWLGRGVITGEMHSLNFKNNTASGSGSQIGGAIFTTGDHPFTLTNSLFTGNNAGFVGGAIIFGSNAAMDVVNCTFEGNTADAYGGAVSVPENDPTRPVSFTNCTFANNTANNPTNGQSGAIHSGAVPGPNNTVTITRCIFSNQSVTNTYGGGGTSLWTDCNYTLVDGGNNLFDNTLAACGCLTAAGSSMLDTPPMLLPLADNGGPTETMALAAGSPAIDAGGGSCTPADQRGVSRVGACDIGAYEFSAPACTIVTNTNDTGTGSLREAVACASPGDVITFDASLAGQTITLTSGEIDINKDLTIDASGVSGITVSGNNTSRIFFIRNFREVRIENLTLQDGKATTAISPEAWGGAVMTANNDIDLSLIDMTFLNNEAEAGGAVVIGGSSSLTVDGCIFDGNDGSLASSLGRGAGAITVRSNTHADIRNSTFLNNLGGNGGAINSVLSTLLVDNCYFEGNDSSPGEALGLEGAGGAIFTDGASLHTDPTPGLLSVTNSIFKNNIGHREGGALFLYTYVISSPNDEVLVDNCTFEGNNVLPDMGSGGIAVGGAIRLQEDGYVIKNSTFVGNTCQRGGGVWADPQSPGGEISNCTFYNNQVTQFGGGVFVNATTNINNCTFSQNSAASNGAAIHENGGSPIITLTNSIFHNNIETGGNTYEKQSNRTLNGNNNIQFPAFGGGTEVTAGITVANPMLLPLADNGGSTETMALSAGSPAIDAGAGCTTTDQIGQARVGTCDIGAYEFSAPACTIVTNTNDTGTGSLREAVACASPGDVITFDAAMGTATINLNSQITIPVDLTIDGDDRITIDGQGITRMFMINNGLVVTLENMTLQDGLSTSGSATSADDRGGAVRVNSGTQAIFSHVNFMNNEAGGYGGGAVGATGTDTQLTFTDCDFTNNRSLTDSEKGAGAIALYGGGNATLTCMDCTFDGNEGVNGGAIGSSGAIHIESCLFQNNNTLTAPTNGYLATNSSPRGSGGAIYTDRPLNLSAHGHRVINCEFINNQGASTGGAVFLFVNGGQQALVDGCHFEGNSVVHAAFAPSEPNHPKGFGGAVFMGMNAAVSGSASDFIVENSSFENNTALNEGGAVWFSRENTTTRVIDGFVRNSTFSGNRAETSAINTRRGGALVTYADTEVRNCTFSGNHADDEAGAFYSYTNASSFTRNILTTNSIFDNNTAGDSEQTSDTYNGNNNLQFPAGSMPIAPSTTFSDPLLNPIADNGGDTKTMSLTVGSPAIDAGTSCLPVDQRGTARVGVCDIGAYEYVPPPCTHVTNTNDSGPGSLRAAVACAASGDIITFDPSLTGQTIILTSGHIQVLRNMTIDAADAPNLTVSGNNISRIFYQGWEYDSGVGANVPSVVTYRNMRFTDGFADGPDYQLDGSGGAIFVLGVGNTSTIENCTFENNETEGWGGGAVYFANATTATVENCIFESNITNPDNDDFDQDKGEKGGTLVSVGDGNLTVRDCEFRNNLAVNGAGIIGGDCNLLVEDCIFDNNNTVTLTRPYADHPMEALPDLRVFGMGAAIYTDGANRNESTKFQTVRRCTFTNNTALGNGGAVYMYGYDGDVLTVEDCSFTGNEVESESFSVFNSSMGGGMRIGGGGIGSRTGPLPPIEVSVRRCTFNDNTSQNSGGGLWVQVGDPDNMIGGTLEIENCTIENNRAYYGDYTTSTNLSTVGTPRGNGGGLSIDLRNNSTALLNNLTVTDNVASWQGGGINLGSTTGPLVTINNTISAYNEAENGGNTWNIKHNINSEAGAGSNNIQSNELLTSVAFLDMLTASTTVADPMLDPLADNGGLTETRALQVGSPAIDAGGGSCTPADQRGATRVGSCDIGAYEFGGAIPPPSSNNPPVVSTVSLTTPEDTPLPFASADFTSAYTDTDSDPMTKVRIESLPTNGVLTFGGTPVVVGQEIPVTSISSLVYTPTTGFTGTDSFGWNGYDGTEYATSSANVNIVVTPSSPANTPPNVSDFTRITTEGTPIPFSPANFFAAYSDADSDPMTKVRIESLPANGTLTFGGSPVVVGQEIPGASLGSLAYAPTAGYTGPDSFGWNGHDGTSYATASANVNITVLPSPPPPPPGGGGGSTVTLFAPGWISAIGQDTASVELTWRDNNVGETGYEIYRRKEDEAIFALVEVVGGGIEEVVTYLDTEGLEPDTRYSYYVRPLNGTAVGPQSDVATGYTYPLMPDLVNVIKACQDGTGSIEVSGEHRSNKFKWYRAEDALSSEAVKNLDGSDFTDPVFETDVISSPRTYYVTSQGQRYESEPRLAITVGIKPRPVAEILSDSTGIFSCDNSVLVQAQAQDSASYTWLRNGSELGTTSVNEFTAVQSGKYTVLVEKDGCTTLSEEVTVSLNYEPFVEIDTRGPFCEGGLLRTSGESGLTYTWMFDSLVIGEGAEQVIDSSGVYTLIAEKFGCQTTLEVDVTVNNFPAENTIAASSLSLCDGGDVTLTAPFAEGMAYRWFRDGGELGGSGQSIRATAEGTYSVILTFPGGCEKTLGALVLEEVSYQKPEITQDLNTLTLVLDSTATVDSVTWYRNSIVQPSFNGMTSIDATVDGTYWAYVQYSDGCEDLSETIRFIFEVTGTEDVREELGLVVYPNPFGSRLSIRTEKPIGSLELAVIDDLGRTVMTRSFESSAQKQTFEIDMSHFASGLYTLRFISDKGVFTQKVMKAE